MRIDPNFAKVDVWERGYFYAFAAQQTYERAVDTVFILERRQDDGSWLITAHQSGSYGIPPNKITDPMPDLRDLYYATEGKDRDPAADALNAGKFWHFAVRTRFRLDAGEHSRFRLSLDRWYLGRPEPRAMR